MARTAKKVSPVKPSPSKLIQSNFSQLASVTQATQKLIDSFVEEKSKVEKRAAELEKSLRACLKIISEAPPTAKAKFNAVIAAASLVGEKIPGTPGVNPSAEKPVKAAPAAKKPAAKKPALKKAAPAAAPKAVAPKPATTAVKKTRGPKSKVAATTTAKTPEPAAVAKPKPAKPAAAKVPRKVALKSPKVAPAKIPLKSTNTESVAPVAAPSTEQPEVK